MAVILVQDLILKLKNLRVQEETDVQEIDDALQQELCLQEETVIKEIKE